MKIMISPIHSRFNTSFCSQTPPRFGMIVVMPFEALFHGLKGSLGFVWTCSSNDHPLSEVLRGAPKRARQGSSSHDQ